MDDAFNVTYLTLDGFVNIDIKYRYLCFVIMLTVYILILCFNCTIVCLILKHKSLHEPMYIFIAALLINSVLFTTNIYPKLLLDVLSDKQIISYSACLFQWFIYYSLAGSEFLLLAAMAYDRYVSICKPLQYSTIMRKSTVSMFLASAWIVPVCEMTVSAALYTNIKLCSYTLKGTYCNSSLYTLQCVRSVVIYLYGVIMLLNIGVFPLLFILFTYTRILIISYRSCKTVRRKAAQTCLPHLLVLINFCCFIFYDVIIVRLELEFAKLVCLIMTLQTILYHPLFNPIIYGVKMKEISKKLKSLFSQLKSH
ncbi:olfactory receptor 4B13-like [Channa argus]|uniref:olfactory receptor 4B13-like n=1 Tax=Channa argus TaxID=215402 RepID=UPI0035223B1C